MRSSKQPRLRKQARLDIMMIVSVISGLLWCFGLSELDLDGRSLGAARIMLGALVLVDLLTSRWPLRYLIYSDGPLSMWPRQVVREGGGDPQIQENDFSIYMISGSIRWTSFCFIMSGIASITFTLGIFTQISCAICWVHVKSLSARSSAVQQAGDTLFRILLFWFIWLPCSKHYSLDAEFFGPVRAGGTSLNTVASTAYMIQVALLYQLPAAFKINRLWSSPTREESAIYYVLANVAFRRTNILTNWLLRHPELTSALTVVTPFLEHAAPIFIFGGRIPGLRLVGVALLVGFHWGLHVCMTLRLFPWICMAAWVALLPSAFWEWCLPLREVKSVPQESGIATWLYDCFSLVVCVLALFSALQSCLDSLPLPEALAQSISATHGWHMLSRIGRLLGMHQQWFLFDNPAKTSYWFRIKGIPKSRSDSGRGSAEGVEIEYDLHKLLRYHCSGDGSYSSLSPKLLADKIVLDSRINEEEDFEEVYGGALWRKFFQNLGQLCNEKTRPRYAAFVPHYVKALHSLWNQRGLHKQLGDLREVKCVAYWRDTSPIGNVSKAVVNCQVMWIVDTFVKDE